MPSEIRIERNIPVPMRDGTVLQADLYLPAGTTTPLPTLIVRTPYDKDTRERPGEIDPFVLEGYAVLVQDVRGRFASAGDFYPFVHEAQDGYDTVEWAAVQPWSNGRCALYGQSYHAAAQYLAAPTAPPHLVTAFPVSGPADLHNTFVYHSGGALELGWQIPYSVHLGRDTATRRDGADERTARLDALVQPGDFPFANWLEPQEYERLPLRAWVDELGDLAPQLADYLAHPDAGRWWDHTDVRRQHGQVRIPMYHVSSWYDILLPGALDHYTGLQENAATEQARQGQRMLIGPWGHLFPYSVPNRGGAGDLDFGPAAEIELLAEELRWFDHWLKGVDNGIMDEDPIRLFTMGRNQWRTESHWPPKGTEYVPFYLDGDAPANTRHGGGRLTRQVPAVDRAPDRFVYDPADPVPTGGGTGLLVRDGGHDQREIEDRDDVLVYTSDVLTDDLEVTGPVTAVLNVASTAVDTDFTVKLVDVRPDGYAQNVVDGILRARYRRSREAPEPLEPGEVYEITVDLWATSHVFAAGHRMRVEVSSSNFPRFDRNLNTGGDPATGTTPVVARQTVLSDGVRPSRIVLPVQPG